MDDVLLPINALVQLLVEANKIEERFCFSIENDGEATTLSVSQLEVKLSFVVD